MAKDSVVAEDGTRPCFFCGQKGHQKKDCPDKLSGKASKKKTEKAAAPTSQPTETKAKVVPPPSAHESKAEKSTASDSKKSVVAEDGSRPCFFCGQKGHQKKDCPDKLSGKKKADKVVEKPSSFPVYSPPAPAAPSRFAAPAAPSAAGPKPCFFCGEPGHMKADCPSFADKKSGKNTAAKKVRPTSSSSSSSSSFGDRGAGGDSYEADYAYDAGTGRRPVPDKPIDAICYICNTNGHKSIFCPKPQKVQDAFRKFIIKPPTKGKSAVGEYVKLMKDCAACLEFRGVIFLYKRLLAAGLPLTSEVQAAMEELHAKGAKDFSALPEIVDEVGPDPKEQLRVIVHSFMYKRTADSSKSVWLQAINHLKSNPKALEGVVDRIKVANVLRRAIPTLNAKQARVVAALLIKAGLLIKEKLSDGRPSLRAQIPADWEAKMLAAEKQAMAPKAAQKVPKKKKKTVEGEEKDGKKKKEKKEKDESESEGEEEGGEEEEESEEEEAPKKKPAAAGVKRKAEDQPAAASKQKKAKKSA